MARTPFDPHNHSFSEAAHRLARTGFYKELEAMIARHSGTKVARVLWEDMFGTREDTDLGIDRNLYVFGTDGSERALSVQERFRRQRFVRYRELTVTQANHASGERGDFWKLQADLYAYGYVYDDMSDFAEAVVVSVPRLKSLFENKCIRPNQSYYERKQQTIWGFPFDELERGGAIVLHQRRSGKIVTNPHALDY